MAAAAGFWSHHMAAGAALTGTAAALTSSAGATTVAGSTAASSGTSGTTGSTGTGDDSSTISSNDFLTLLVTEMKNQDPTSDQDPNAYINQLVQVNSLEQLIDINQNLTTALGTPSSGTGTVGSAAAPSSGASPGVAGLTAQNALSQIQGAARAKAGAEAGVQPSVSGAAGSDPAATFAARLHHAPGNLAVPEANPAASHVAHALDGHSRKQPIGSRLHGVQ
jgi:flagellar basal-body rod modification protein FlgD